MPTADKLNEILIRGVSQHCSDVHIATGAPVRARIYGAITNIGDRALTALQVDEILEFLMKDVKLRKEFESNGQLDMSYEIPRVARFRVNIFRQHSAKSAVFRVLNENIPPFDSLGLLPEIKELTNLRKGMVLVTGATGSGKSTTLAAMIDIINRTMPKHIITLEAPIEYQHWHQMSNMSQREVGRDVRDFNSGLRAALRQDPDVILVGEMRDRETTDVAMRAAETGHLLLSTLHTNGAVETINRIVDMYPEAQHHQVRNQLSSTIEAVVSQQLLPKKEGKGYVVAVELMLKNREVQNLIIDNRILELHDYLLSQSAREEGMVSMDTSIYELYDRGLITKETAIAYAVDRRQMRINLS